MQIINAESIEKAALQSDPFDHLIVPDFIPADALIRVNADYPEINEAANYDLESLRYGPAFAELIAELASGEISQRIGGKFGLDLVDCRTSITVRRYCERTDGNIHADHRSKIITVLVYFNETWPHEGGKLRLLRSKDDIENYAAEVEPIGGSLMAFRRTNHSWHGHKEFVGERKMLQLNYIKSSVLSMTHQKVNRLSTRIQKRVLGIR